MELASILLEDPRTRFEIQVSKRQQVHIPINGQVTQVGMGSKARLCTHVRDSVLTLFDTSVTYYRAVEEQFELQVSILKTGRSTNGRSVGRWFDKGGLYRCIGKG